MLETQVNRKVDCRFSLLSCLGIVVLLSLTIRSGNLHLITNVIRISLPFGEWILRMTLNGGSLGSAIDWQSLSLEFVDTSCFTGVMPVPVCESMCPPPGAPLFSVLSCIKEGLEVVSRTYPLECCINCAGFVVTGESHRVATGKHPIIP